MGLPVDGGALSLGRPFNALAAPLLANTPELEDSAILRFATLPLSPDSQAIAQTLVFPNLNDH